jgi:hypothetical protein
MHRNNPRSVHRLAVKAVTVAAATSVACMYGLAGTASASAGVVSSAGQTPAVVGPLLDFFSFGDNIGLPLVCGTAAAGVGDGAAQYGFAQEASTLIDAIDNFCSTASTDGADYIAEGQATDSPLAGFNPVANPMLQSTGSSVSEFGTTYGTALAPFGPTIAGLGGTIEWFEGS